MTEPVPARPKVVPNRPSAPAAQRGLKVRFYSRMKPRRIYPLVVEAQPAGPEAAARGSTVAVLRPVIPGALVAPPEQPLDVGQLNARATFYVTPLARGSLRDARVELHQHGKKTDQVGLSMRATTQRTTWLLLALTILIPWLVYHYTQPGNQFTGPIPRPAKAPPNPRAADEQPNKPQGDNGQARVADRITPMAAPGEYLEYRINNWFADSTPRELAPVRTHVVPHVARGLGKVYQIACDLQPDQLWFYIAAVLLGLTIISLALHRARRSSRRQQVVVSAAPPVPVGASAETLPLRPREEPPLTVQPID
jgi:hypothetical protein